MKPLHGYQMHASFVMPAREYAEIWRLVAGLMLAFFAYLALNQFFFQIVFSLISGDRAQFLSCLLYTSPSPRDKRQSRMPSSA